MAKRYRLLASWEGQRKWVEGTSKRDVLRKREKLIAEWQAGLAPVSGSMTFREWTARWARSYRGDVSLPYAKDQASILKNHIYPMIGAMRMEKILPIHIQEIFRETAGLSASSNHKIFVLLSQIFRAAVQNDVCRKNPLEGMKPPKGTGKSARRSISTSERDAITTACDAMGERGLLPLIVLLAGLRPGEAAALRWEDVDLADGWITVDKAVKRDDTIGPPKTAAGVRRVPIQAELAQRLEPLKREPSALVCTNAQGGRLTSSSVRAVWHAVLRQVNIDQGVLLVRNQLIPPLWTAPDLTLYCLRHTYCTDLEAAGVPINVARQLMGHSSIAVTAEIYTHTRQDAMEDARAKMDKLQGRK